MLWLSHDNSLLMLLKHRLFQVAMETNIAKGVQVIPANIQMLMLAKNNALLTCLKQGIQ